MTGDRSTAQGSARPTEPSAWEAAYLRFETPEVEVRKFESRLRDLGAEGWPRDAQVVELFCGRGSGLRALQRLGFTHIEGVDLSPVFVERYEGPGSVTVGDCRDLPFPDNSRDILIVQGGLHHLLELPRDLDRTVAEAHRVLRPGGRFVMVEPWLTPFLRVVHAVCRVGLARRLSPKIDALATMIEHEQTTYDQWLGQPAVVLASIRERFAVEREATGWGKLSLVGRKR